MMSVENAEHPEFEITKLWTAAEHLLHKIILFLLHEIEMVVGIDPLAIKMTSDVLDETVRRDVGSDRLRVEWDPEFLEVGTFAEEWQERASTFQGEFEANHGERADW
jgi:hypothetical protein